MSDGRGEFERRLNRLAQKHGAPSAGHAGTLSGDRQIVPRPRRLRFRLHLRAFVLLMIAFMAFKAIMLASLGDAVYGARVMMLARGTIPEEIAAVVMGLDPVSKLVGELLGPFF